MTTTNYTNFYLTTCASLNSSSILCSVVMYQELKGLSDKQHGSTFNKHWKFNIKHMFSGTSRFCENSLIPREEKHGDIRFLFMCCRGRHLIVLLKLLQIAKFVCIQVPNSIKIGLVYMLEEDCGEGVHSILSSIFMEAATGAIQQMTNVSI